MKKEERTKCPWCEVEMVVIDERDFYDELLLKCSICGYEVWE